VISLPACSLVLPWPSTVWSLRRLDAGAFEGRDELVGLGAANADGAADAKVSRSSDDSATSRPRLMISTWSTGCGTSVSTWLETSTVRSPAANARRTSCGRHPFGVEAVCRLVEDQQLRVAEQRCREPETLPHAERVGVCLVAPRDLQPIAAWPGLNAGHARL
jgi:hypothetical protein